MMLMKTVPYRKTNYIIFQSNSDITFEIKHLSLSLNYCNLETSQETTTQQELKESTLNPGAESKHLGFTPRLKTSIISFQGPIVSLETKTDIMVTKTDRNCTQRDQDASFVRS